MKKRMLTGLSLLLATSVGLILAMPQRVHTQVQDIIPPSLVELSFSPNNIDVSTASQVIAVNVRGRRTRSLVTSPVRFISEARRDNNSDSAI